MELRALDWQKHIYLQGFAGTQPALPFTFDALELAAERVMTPRAFAYVAGAAGNETGLRGNVTAFEKCKIVPRMLRDVTSCDPGITLFKNKLASPFLLSPVGVLELAHPMADLAVARAAQRCNVPYIFSNQASFAMEETAAVMGNATRWFQLYWSKSRELVASFVERAERCGCTAIVVTLDTTMLGWRNRDLQMAYLPFLEGKGIAQYTSDPVFQKMMDEPEVGNEKRRVTLQSISGLISMVKRYPGNGFLKKLRSGRPVKAVRKFIQTYSNPATTWDDLKFLRDRTKLPVLLKGILHADDARKAMDSGMDGIIVSNHGGRQLDGVISTFEALPAITSAVNKKIPIILDSGFRGGADAFKALACGADAVCIGRPYVYALALAGEQGVYELLRNYLSEFELTMRLAGCRNVAEIGENVIRQA